ncbi:MAG: flagellar hook-associated protein FlgL [Rhodocyclaceae bacterium]
MRISTNMIYEKGVFALQRQTADLLYTQQQVSTGRRILTPSDDPIASARVLELGQSKAVNTQFGKNIAYADDNLRLLEGKLVGVGDVLQYSRERAVQAGNGVMTGEDLRYIATDLKSQFDALLALANSQDGQGDYIFSGYKANTQPFTGGLNGVTYNGDQGGRTIQVSASRFMPVSLPGVDIFDRSRIIDVNALRTPTEDKPTTNDALYSFKGNNNQGTAPALEVSFDAATVDPEVDLGKRYIVSYTQPDPAVPGTWSVERIRNDGVREAVAFTPDPPPPAAATTLTFNGLSIAIPADPPPVDDNDFTPLADGDNFEVFVASTNVFENYAMVVSALDDNVGVGVAGGVAFALENLDFALDNVLKVRAQIGSQMVETEQLKNLGEDLNLQYAQAISRLADVDYTEALSRLVQQQTYLQAAQQSFLRVSGLSLFNFLS